VLAAQQGDGLKARVDAECSESAADVKRTLLVVGVALSALAAAGIAWSSESFDSGPPQIRVYGGGQWDNQAGTRRTISLEATTNPAGLDAHGSFRYAGDRPAPAAR
jgi:hypothetical protein